MMDEIRIKGLEIFAKHGVLPEENSLGQKFVISATLFCDTGAAGRSDKLSDSVNYAEISGFIKKITEENVFQLLEALAWQIAKEVLLAYPLVKKITVEIEKPWAPVHLPLDTVSVKITRGWNDVYLGIGSNMGDKRENILAAIELLREDEETRVVQVSRLIETAPVGFLEQEDFLNGAVHIRTLRSPQELLSLIAEIEEKGKRERVIHWGPRTIDLDILLYNDEIIEEENLVIPHVEMTNRMFVLEPLCEIAPYVVHPLTNQRIIELKEILEKEQP